LHVDQRQGVATAASDDVAIAATAAVTSVTRCLPALLLLLLLLPGSSW
jgi:hypothetical protein